MQVHVSIGENHRFELREALLVYGDRQRSFVTRHQVTTPQKRPTNTRTGPAAYAWISRVAGAFALGPILRRSSP